MSNSVIETINVYRNPDYAQIVWVSIKTNDGFEGIGETSYVPETVESFILGPASDYLLGKDPSRIDLHWEKISKLGSSKRGNYSAEKIGLSAIDMALWDLSARKLNVPLYELLGGLYRDKIKVYNTCAGYSYGVNRKPYEAGDIDFRQDKPYEDQHAFINDPAGLAESLLEEGFSAMKIWPYDQFVSNTDGNMIDLAQLEEGTEPFRIIRQNLLSLINLFGLKTQYRWIISILYTSLRILQQYLLLHQKLCQQDGVLERCLKSGQFQFVCLIFLGLEEYLKQKKYLVWLRLIIFQSQHMIVLGH